MYLKEHHAVRDNNKVRLKVHNMQLLVSSYVFVVNVHIHVASNSFFHLNNHVLMIR